MTKLTRADKDRTKVVRGALVVYSALLDSLEQMDISLKMELALTDRALFVALNAIARDREHFCKSFLAVTESEITEFDRLIGAVFDDQGRPVKSPVGVQ